MEAQTREQIYTLDEIQKNLIALEGHFRDFPLVEKDTDESYFCLNCVQKHLYFIEVLSDEGFKFFPQHAYSFVKLKEWASNLRGNLDDITFNDIPNILSEIDTFRKTFSYKCYKCECKTCQNFTDQEQNEDNLHLIG